MRVHVDSIDKGIAYAATLIGDLRDAGDGGDHIRQVTALVERATELPMATAYLAAVAGSLLATYMEQADREARIADRAERETSEAARIRQWIVELSQLTQGKPEGWDWVRMAAAAQSLSAFADGGRVRVGR